MAEKRFLRVTAEVRQGYNGWKKKGEESKALGRSYRKILRLQKSLLPFTSTANAYGRLEFGRDLAASVGFREELFNG